VNIDNQQDSFEHLVRHAATFSAQGKTNAQIVAELSAIGISNDVAATLATRGEALGRLELLKHSRLSFLVGAGLAAIGMATTYWAFAAAGAGM
jgi:hypothetical protein